MKTIKIKDGIHKGELGVVVEELRRGLLLKVLTLEGDFHYYDDEGYEVK